MMSPATLHTVTAPSPLGPLRLFASADALVALYLPNTADQGLGHALARALPSQSPLLERTAAQLAEYFSGTRLDFALPLAPEGTPFQQSVWQALAQIPFGRTQSYGAIAAVIGKPSASRAVGAANGQNPIAIILPCHRVIGANGALTGYGGGLPAKRWLLAHEQQHACAPGTLFSSR